MSETHEKEITELKHEAIPGYATAFYIVLAVTCAILGFLVFTHMP